MIHSFLERNIKLLLTLVFVMTGLTAMADPSLEISSEILYKGTSVAKGTQVQYAKFTATASELKGPVDVYLTGSNRAMFSVNVSSVSNGVTEVIVSYLPTAVGKHTAYINFDSADTPTISCGYSINAVCIDANNPPLITVNSASLTTFSAKAGEKHEQTISVTTRGLPDFGKVKVEGTPTGAFVLSNTTLMKDGNAQIKITFSPKTTGTFTDVISFSALEAETVTLTVTGVCGTGQQPETTEGDKLPLDASDAKTLYTTSFDGVERNKPLALNGWKNLALDGTRAWWGYDFDGDACAKVTPFDSKIASGKGEKCSMLLVSPALNYKDAASKLVTFRLMGQYLYEGQPDLLEVCYIEPDEEGLYIQPLQMSIPATTDEANEWMDYVIDLDGQQVADVFFIGFRFTSTRGADCSATYYVDDFSWGRTDVKQIKVRLTSTDLMHVTPSEQDGYEVKGIIVEGHNLTDKIDISLYGADKKHFVLGTTSLPANGGEVKLTLGGDAAEEAVEKDATYGVSLVTKSAGAPVLYTDMFFYIDDVTSGVKQVTDNSSIKFNDVYTIDGRRAKSIRPGVIYVTRGGKKNRS